MITCWFIFSIAAVTVSNSLSLPSTPVISNCNIETIQVHLNGWVAPSPPKKVCFFNSILFEFGYYYITLIAYNQDR